MLERMDYGWRRGGGGGGGGCTKFDLILGSTVRGVAVLYQVHGTLASLEFNGFHRSFPVVLHRLHNLSFCPINLMLAIYHMHCNAIVGVTLFHGSFVICHLYFQCSL